MSRWYLLNFNVHKKYQGILLSADSGNSHQRFWIKKSSKLVFNRQAFQVYYDAGDLQTILGEKPADTPS